MTKSRLSPGFPVATALNDSYSLIAPELSGRTPEKTKVEHPFARAVERNSSTMDVP